MDDLREDVTRLQYVRVLLDDALLEELAVKEGLVPKSNSKSSWVPHSPEEHDHGIYMTFELKDD